MGVAIIVPVCVCLVYGCQISQERKREIFVRRSLQAKVRTVCLYNFICIANRPQITYWQCILIKFQ